MNISYAHFWTGVFAWINQAASQANGWVMHLGLDLLTHIVKDFFEATDQAYAVEKQFLTGARLY